MALDGITIAALTRELSDLLTDCRISKIAQPEADELLLTIKGKCGQRRLLLSAGASLPLLYLTETNKPSPITAPNFCMLLRKHIANGRILSITQPGLERIVRFEIEHLDEMGDLRRKTLILELMGKHSNLIFCDETGRIIDAIKHVSFQTSSVREVLPGRDYFVPHTQDKADPLCTSDEEFVRLIGSRPMPLSKALYSCYTGISPVIAEELCFRAGLESDRIANSYSELELIHLFRRFDELMDAVKEGTYSPAIICDQEGTPVEFSAVPLTMYGELSCTPNPSMSAVLEQFYAMKNTVTRIRQKSSDLRRIVGTALDRNRKKYDLQLKQLKDTEKREKYRIYGELINTYGYGLEEGVKSFKATNYYNGEEVTIPLDPQLSPQENAKKYFDRYSKLKRTYEALTDLTQETRAEIEHLESVATFLDLALSEEDLVQVKEELMDSGYIRRKYTGGKNKKVKITSVPFHYLSADGFHIYVGKNNYQNEELTFNVASGSDWWFHAKGAPGSHVIVKAEGKPLPDATFEDAARLAAYYSKNRQSKKVEVDYVQKKQVKKPNGAKPGFVVYYTNYSMVIDTDISHIREVK